ncbi:MAG: response regulator [Pedosphaera sp.]|nr:response regulator [Pedosphaera sp.]
MGCRPHVHRDVAHRGTGQESATALPTKTKVLVIEDNEQNLYLATFLLERHGLEIIPARTGPQGVDLAAHDRPDLILLDIQLPGMDGYEVARQLKLIPSLAGVPIVAVTRNVTGRKQAEAELRESERRFAELFANVEMLTVILDRDGRVAFCNDYLLRLTGWQRAEVLGKDWFKMFVPPELGLRSRYENNIANGAISSHFENDILTRARVGGGALPGTTQCSAIRAGAWSAPPAWARTSPSVNGPKPPCAKAKRNSGP